MKTIGLIAIVVAIGLVVSLGTIKFLAWWERVEDGSEE